MPSIYNIRFFLSLFKLKQQQNYRPSMFGFLRSEVFRAYLTESDTSYSIHSLCYYISLKITITLKKMYHASDQALSLWFTGNSSVTWSNIIIWTKKPACRALWAYSENEMDWFSLHPVEATEGSQHHFSKNVFWKKKKKISQMIFWWEKHEKILEKEEVNDISGKLSQCQVKLQA